MSQALGGRERVRTTHSILSRSLLARALAASNARLLSSGNRTSKLPTLRHGPRVSNRNERYAQPFSLGGIKQNPRETK